MSKKLSLSGQSCKTVEEVFNDFVISQTAQGLSEATIATYRCHIHSISKHLDIQKPTNTLTKGDLKAMVGIYAQGATGAQLHFFLLSSTIGAKRDLPPGADLGAAAGSPGDLREGFQSSGGASAAASRRACVGDYRADAWHCLSEHPGRMCQPFFVLR